MKIYFANALFSEADFAFNAQLVEKLRKAAPSLDIYLPQENASINDKNAYADSKMIAQADTEKVLAADLMIAVLDGPTIDVGVATEIGVAYAKHIPILGLYTDSRRLGATNQQKLAALQDVAENQFHYLNLYTIGLIKLNGAVFTNSADLIQAVLKRAQ
ncbi:nucleoside 2-deoxyribosyltransferase [Lacticaseibacillus camelliae]|uniref:Nucleoside 2-deoxyribosyltransferase n=1 Tax=Lacticaseibacillus camelliae DSM 22697 = JCM 13995 TaxID=1423730 RepID=A0A0R2F924_9LACO|nr:nucleoside 2-deoxyribosyltransferase [Lacticaseibacillus camelliae]KRN24857.1 Nucleoside 2-deoxyribosyltransferase [Lacticaseibacillus camelliae DSM 22697 = JCM 13995]